MYYEIKWLFEKREITICLLFQLAKKSKNRQTDLRLDSCKCSSQPGGEPSAIFVNVNMRGI